MGVLSDNFQTSGFQFKARKKTSFDGAVLTSTVDLFPSKGSCVTPAKLTWKLPKPLGFSAFCIDKLEMDKGGKYRLDLSTDKVYPGLKLECKSDLAHFSNMIAGCAYTGLKDTQIKVETKATKPQDFTCEVTHTVGIMTCMIKCGMASLISPDVSVRFLSGNFVGLLFAKERFSVCITQCSYKLSNELTCAAAVEYGGKKSGNFSVGVSYDVKKGTVLKAKVQQDQSLHCSLRHSLAKGFTMIAGGKCDTKKGDYTYGLQISIE